MQHWLELRDKDKERSHEAVMYDKQIAIADKRFAHDSDLRRMDAAAADASDEWAALTAVVQAQSDEASKTGGWVAALSASVRPITTYWLLALYTMAKVFSIVISIDGEEPFLLAVRAVYTDTDAALLSSILSFWFIDRSLRKKA
jgi:hypothetical protein